MYVCMVITYSNSMDQPGCGCQSCSWSVEQGRMSFSLSPFAPEGFIPRDGFGSPVPTGRKAKINKVVKAHIVNHAL